MIPNLMPNPRLLSLLIAAPFVAGACTTAGSEEATEAALATPAAEAATSAPTVTPSPEAVVPDQTPEAAAWLDIELTDAESGESFTLASLRGEVVAIEPMAVWCSNCKAQQDNVKQVYPEVEASGVQYISLGIDPGEKPESLAKYADNRGYEWTFVQSPNEFSRALNDLFGPQILSAPSTPLIVLDADGEVHAQLYGFHGPDELLGLLEEANAA